MLNTTPVVPGPISESLAGALDQADRLSAVHPDDLSFPWVNRSRGEVVLTAVTAAGREQAASFRASVPVRIEEVRHSRSYLKHIMDSAIGRQNQAGVTVWATFPDAEHNRIILEVTSLPQSFVAQLAAAYDPSALALVAARDPGSGPQ
ncbi:hypothetical protein [Sinomonas sp. G460-2]|uniref:hypothetical protein n=1 Tax=Sinomonas sp. G460-2 TaxID=3393464 RepID=UPI0039F0A999